MLMKRSSLVLISTLAAHCAVGATQDLSGTWHLDVLDFPMSVHFNYFPPDAFLVGGQSFGIERLAPELSATTVSLPGEPDFATYTAEGDGLLLGVEPEGSFQFQFNSGRDVMVEVPLDRSEGYFAVGVREPATLALAELAGTWQVNQIEMPRQMTWSNQGQQLSGGGLFFAHREELTISGDGTVAGIGTISIQDKSIQLDFGEAPDLLHINAAKDVLIQVKHDLVDDGQQEVQLMTVVTKKPTSLVPADLVGSWRLSEIELPPAISVYQTDFGSGPVPALNNGTRFRAETFLVIVKENGTVVTERGERLDWTIIDGNVRVTAPDDEVNFSVNASKNLLVNAGQDDAGVWLTLLTRTPEPVALPAPAVTFAPPQDGALELTWGGGMLEAAESPTGPWIPQPDIRSPFQIETLGSGRFYRVVQPE